jgi:flagellar protein FlaI
MGAVPRESESIGRDREYKSDPSKQNGGEFQESSKQILEEYVISPPFSSVKIMKSKEDGILTYTVVEPPLSEKEDNFFKRVRSQFISSIVSYPEAREDRINLMKSFLKSVNVPPSGALPDQELEKILYYITREFEGYGKVEVPMVDENVEDISCVGPDTPLYVVHKKYGSIVSNLKFESEEELDAFVRLVVQRSGKHISISAPMVDCSLPNGARLQATLGREVTKNGSTFTVRRFKRDPFTPIDLIKLGTMNTDIAVYLWLAIESGENMFIIGGTASGKTTTLNSILLFIPPGKKIVSIEDTRELNIPHENWVQSLTRQGIGDVNPSTRKKVGELDMFDLLVSSLRQRPDYIIVGEVRGREAYTVFQSMATGQPAIGTFHSSDVPSFIHRLEGEPLKIPRSMISALDIVILQSLTNVANTTVRRIKSIVEISGMDSTTNEILTNTVFQWDPILDSFKYSGHSNLEERMITRNNWSLEHLNDEISRRKEFLEKMSKAQTIDFSNFPGIINKYYADQRQDDQTEHRKRGSD